MTKYTVFVSHGSGWEPIGEYVASTPAAAERAAAAKELTGETTSAYFAAVPSRSWRPTKLTATVAFVAEKDTT